MEEACLGHMGRCLQGNRLHLIVVVGSLCKVRWEKMSQMVQLCGMSSANRLQLCGVRHRGGCTSLGMRFDQTGALGVVRLDCGRECSLCQRWPDVGVDWHIAVHT